MFDDVQDDDNKFALVLAKIKLWVLRTWTQTTLSEKVIEVPFPDARGLFQIVNALMQVGDRICFSGEEVSFWLL
jgi:hypothetical protein